MAVYTKTGDKGKTSTFNGKRVSKASKIIDAIGSVDELNSYLGIIGGLNDIQTNLFLINSILAGTKLDFPKSETKKLETQIDKWEGTMPVLKNFIHYSGNIKARHIYYARALARRAERYLVSYSKVKELNPDVLVYINRLSDYLFMLARYTNFKLKIKEKRWKLDNSK